MSYAVLLHAFNMQNVMPPGRQNFTTEGFAFGWPLYGQGGRELPWFQRVLLANGSFVFDFVSCASTTQRSWGSTVAVSSPDHKCIYKGQRGRQGGQDECRSLLWFVTYVTMMKLPCLEPTQRLQLEHRCCCNDAPGIPSNRLRAHRTIL